MAKTYLEYRLDNGTDYPVLFHYHGIDKDEVSLRMNCDYFVKDGLVYEKVASEAASNGFIIYVTVSEDEEAKYGSAPSFLYQYGIKLEVRHFNETSDNYPLITTITFQDDDDIELKMKSDYITVNGSRWNKTSTEIDEDRKVFVYYAIPSN